MPTGIVVDPLDWSMVRKLKTGTDFNSTLLGAGTTDTVPMLLGIPVYVSPQMTDYTGLVVDATAVVSAVGQVLVGVSEHQYFSSDWWPFAARGGSVTP